MKTKNLIIFHFQPLELYPPIMNILKFGEKYSSEFNIYVITNYSSIKLRPFKAIKSNIYIVRVNKLKKKSFLFKRLLNYLVFYLRCLYYLIKYCPKVVLYFETISSLPAILYKLLRRDKISLFAHYHEYTSLQEYKNGMILNRFNHWLENKYFKIYTWVSHTNQFRLDKFLLDHKLKFKNNNIFMIMPNYPSINWRTDKKRLLNNPIKFVMLGAIGYDTMFLKEIIEWTSARPSLVKLDFYTNNIDKKAKDYIDKYTYTNITLFDAIDYNQIPEILASYDIGLVLYRPYSDNIIFGAPNKIFEYNVCGLDVWFPMEMVGSYPYISLDTFPKIVPINFSKLDDIDIDKMVNLKNDNCNNSKYVYEDIYTDIYTAISKSFNHY